MIHPLAALKAAGVSIWLDDLSRERLVRHEFVLAPAAESAVASIQGGDVDHYALAAAREDEGAPVFETPGKHFVCSSLRGIHRLRRKHPEAS